MGSMVHLHVHTEYSSLDGLGNVKDYVAKAVDLGMPALAITDHGLLCGIPEFYHEARKANIEPVLGSEFYFIDDASYRPGKGEPQLPRYHVTVLARGFEGYKTLTELSTESHRNFYYKPLIDRRMLEALGDAAQHLTVLSGCAGSKLSQLLMAEENEAAVEELLWWRETFPHYYIELMHHDTAFDKSLNESLVAMARRYDVPWVVTNDPHYVVPEDDCHHDALLAIQTGDDLDNPNRFRFDGTGYHLRSRAEMRRAFRPYGDEVWKPGVRNTLRIAKDCQVRIPQWENRVWQIPNFPDVDDAYAEVKRLAKRALRKRGLADKPEYVERMKHELKVIKQANISDFLLITRDSIKEAQRRGIPVGPGRGSVCGTLVGYLIDLHKVDPVRYKLLFERFLNPARPRMPDIDTDFGKERRDEMFGYVAERFGADNVAHVAAYGRMKVKAAFQSLASAYGIAHQDRIRLSKEIVEDDETDDFILPEEVETNFPALRDQLARLSGIKRGVSPHPAGIIIASPEARIREQMPEMYLPSSKRMVSQYNLEAVEDMGLMKQDFLSLRALDTIAEAVRLIEERTGERLDPDSWIPDEEPEDAKVYKMLSRGLTAGVFQMEGATNTRGCREVRPKNFEDVVSITSLYRTGPIKAGFPKQFVENRQRNSIEYIHPSLEPILGDTWGVILYQEQVMEIGRTCAGFDDTLVDDIKEAIKHKKSSMMDDMRPLFIAGAKKTVKMNKASAEEIWKQIEGYSGYSYNRSHAVAYSLVTYQTARLKRLYPQEYIAALLRTVPPIKDNREKRTSYLRDAATLGINAVPPHINLSDAKAVPEGNTIRFGFCDLSGIGDKQAAKIIAGRPPGGYTSLDQVEQAVNNMGAMAVLGAAGALTDLGVESTEAQAEALLHWTLSDRMAKWRRKYDDVTCWPHEAQDFDDVCIIGMITSAKKDRTKTGKEYMTWKVTSSQTQEYLVRLWSETAKHWSLPVGSIVLLQGRWEPRWLNLSIGAAKGVKVIKRASKD